MLYVCDFLPALLAANIREQTGSLGYLVKQSRGPRKRAQHMQARNLRA